MNLEIEIQPMLNIKQAAQCLGCSVSMMRKMKRLGTGPVYHRVGRSLRYAPDDLRSFMNACRKEVK